MKRMIHFIVMAVMLITVYSKSVAEVSGYPLQTGPTAFNLINKSGEQLNVFVRTIAFDQERAREYVHFKEGKWVYTSEPGPLENLIAPGFYSHAVPAGSSYQGNYPNFVALITAKSATAEASKSIPVNFVLKSVTIGRDATGLTINFNEQ